MKLTEKGDKDPAMHHYTMPMAEKTNELSEEGYTDQFVIVDGKLKSSNTGKKFDPQDVKIDKHYRFEGTSDPGDMTILYAIETSDGEKGTIVDGFGTYSDLDLSEFMKQVEEYQNQNNPDGNVKGDF